MSFVDFLKKNVIVYFIIVTCVTAATGIMGVIYEPQRLIGYEAFFSPLIAGLIGVIPSFITYSKKELSFRQMVVRKIIQLILLEALLNILNYILGGISKVNQAISLSVSTFIIFMIVHFVFWVTDCKKAEELNSDLKQFQGK